MTTRMEQLNKRRKVKLVLVQAWVPEPLHTRFRKRYKEHGAISKLIRTAMEVSVERSLDYFKDPSDVAGEVIDSCQTSKTEQSTRSSTDSSTQSQEEERQLFLAGFPLP